MIILESTTSDFGLLGCCLPIQVEAMAVRFRLFLAEAEDSQAEVALEVLAEVASVVAEPVEVGNFQ